MTDIGEWRMSVHATERACDMALEPGEIREAILRPDVIQPVPEEYPRHQRLHVKGRIALVVDPGDKEVVTCLWKTDKAFHRTLEEDLQRIRAHDPAPPPREKEKPKVATRIIEEKIDDLDGTPADETITFGIDDDWYEIDLSKNNAETVREYLGELIIVARPVKKARATKIKSGPSDAAKIRAWAKENGIDVPPRGRIPANIAAEWKAFISYQEDN